MGIADCKLTKYEGGALLEWYWQVKTGVLWETPVSTPLCPPQFPHALAWDSIRTSAVRGRRLTVRPQWHDLRQFAHIYGEGQEKMAKIAFGVIFCFGRDANRAITALWATPAVRSHSSVLITFLCSFMYLFIRSTVPVSTDSSRCQKVYDRNFGRN
jgi:hypothetical protein